MKIILMNILYAIYATKKKIMIPMIFAIEMKGI